MTKIPNWTLKEKWRVFTEWSNDNNKNISVVINKESYWPKGWSIIRTLNGTVTKKIGFEKTRREAEYIAVNYMKKHRS